MARPNTATIVNMIRTTRSAYASECSPPAKSRNANANDAVMKIGSPHGVPVCCDW